MLLHRLPPFPLNISYSVPSPNTEYILVIEDIDDRDELVNEVIESTASGEIEFTLPEYFQLYDKMFLLTIYEAIPVTDEYDRGDTLVIDNLEITRPYVDVTKLVSGASEIQKYWEYETIARALIDSVCSGFYYTTHDMEVNGSGTDYLPLRQDVYKILKVYENNALVWDSSQDPQALGDWNYLLTKDKSAIVKDPVRSVGSYVMQTSKPVGKPLAESDSFDIYDTADSGVTIAVRPGVSFPLPYNYIVVTEVGWRVVPSDIKDATVMLINDLSCGKLDYYKRYVTSYSTDQYRIQFDKTVLDGTGNILVDKILDKYKQQINGYYGVL